MTHGTTDTVHINDDDIQLAEAAAALKDAAVKLGGHAMTTARAARRELIRVADLHPYALAGGAGGVGFVAGGGLTAPATRALIGMGLKLGSAFVLDAAITALRGPLKPSPQGGQDVAASSNSSTRPDSSEQGPEAASREAASREAARSPETTTRGNGTANP